MTRPGSLAAGAALSVYAATLANACAALFWPRIAAQLIFLGVCAGGLAALGTAAVPGRLRDRARSHEGALLAIALLAGLGAHVAMGAISRRLLPGAGLELLSFPPWFLALAAAPFAVVAAAVVAWCAGGEARRAGWLVAGLGIGWLAAAGLGGSSLSVRTPWFGGRLLEFRDAGGGSSDLGIDRRLSEDLVAPATGAPLTFVPKAGRDQRVDVLMVGFPNGPVLTTLLGWRRARLTILEEDPALAAEVLKRWPALEAARAAGRARFVYGSPRWSLERSRARYDLVVLSEGWSFGAYLSRALHPRRDHLWTVEGLRSAIAHLAPGGYLLAQRTGMGRVVATLREASGLPGAEFAEKLLIIGERGRLSSQCWYRPEGLSDRMSLRTAVIFAREQGTQLLYRPSKYPSLSFYDPLVRSERVKGLYFSTPLDLSPPVDERPFFDHLERPAISPMGRSMPEELEPVEARTPLRLIPSGDRGTWSLLLFGAAAAVGILATGLRGARRGCGEAVAAARAWAPAVFLGALAALALAAFDAWAHWLAPSAPTAQAAVAALLLGGVAGWVATAGRHAAGARSGRFHGLLLLAAALSLAAYGAYRAAPAIPRLGFVASALVVAVAGALLGVLLGRGVSGAARELGSRFPGAGGWIAGALLCGAALAWIAGALAATHFGYRLHWALAAVSALAALRALRRLPAPTATSKSDAPGSKNPP